MADYKAMSIRIPPEAHRALRDLQEKDGILPGTRVRAWVLEKLDPALLEASRKQIHRETKPSARPTPSSSSKRRKKR